MKPKGCVKLIVFLVAGWSGNSAKQNFGLLRELLEKIPGVGVVVPEYMDVKGPFTKFRTRRSIDEYALRVEHALEGIEKTYSGVPIIAVGHSMGALILRLLYRPGRFSEVIFAGGPHRGFSKRLLWITPLAFILRVKPFFQMLTGSRFLEDLGELPNGIYIGGGADKVVPALSAAPLEARRRIVLHACTHKMFPQDEETAKYSAIPVVVEIVEKHMQKAL